MNYPKAIRIARSIADLSQGELADRAQIDRSYLSLIESGKRQASLDTIQKIARALKLPFHLLTLLGSEQQDIKEIGINQIEDLSLALTKLLLQAPHDESDTKDLSTSADTRPPKKPPGSAVSARSRSRKIGDAS